MKAIVVLIVSLLSKEIVSSLPDSPPPVPAPRAGSIPVAVSPTPPATPPSPTRPPDVLYSTLDIAASGQTSQEHTYDNAGPGTSNLENATLNPVAQPPTTPDGTVYAELVLNSKSPSSPTPPTTPTKPSNPVPPIQKPNIDVTVTLTPAEAAQAVKAGAAAKAAITPTPTTTTAGKVGKLPSKPKSSGNVLQRLINRLTTAKAPTKPKITKGDIQGPTNFKQLQQDPNPTTPTTLPTVPKATTPAAESSPSQSTGQQSVETLQPKTNFSVIDPTPPTSPVPAQVIPSGPPTEAPTTTPPSIDVTTYLRLPQPPTPNEEQKIILKGLENAVITSLRVPIYSSTPGTPAATALATAATEAAKNLLNYLLETIKYPPEVVKTAISSMQKNIDEKYAVLNSRQTKPYIPLSYQALLQSSLQNITAEKKQLPPVDTTAPTQSPTNSSAIGTLQEVSTTVPQLSNNDTTKMNESIANDLATIVKSLTYKTISTVSTTLAAKYIINQLQGKYGPSLKTFVNTFLNQGINQLGLQATDNNDPNNPKAGSKLLPYITDLTPVMRAILTQIPDPTKPTTTQTTTQENPISTTPKSAPKETQSLSFTERATQIDTLIAAASNNSSKVDISNLLNLLNTQATEAKALDGTQKVNTNMTAVTSKRKQLILTLLDQNSPDTITIVNQALKDQVNDLLFTYKNKDNPQSELLATIKSAQEQNLKSLTSVANSNQRPVRSNLNALDSYYLQLQKTIGLTPQNPVQQATPTNQDNTAGSTTSPSTGKLPVKTETPAPQPERPLPPSPTPPPTPEPATPVINIAPETLSTAQRGAIIRTVVKALNDGATKTVQGVKTTGRTVDVTKTIVDTLINKNNLTHGQVQTFLNDNPTLLQDYQTQTKRNASIQKSLQNALNASAEAKAKAAGASGSGGKTGPKTGTRGAV